LAHSDAPYAAGKAAARAAANGGVPASGRDPSEPSNPPRESSSDPSTTPAVPETPQAGVERIILDDRAIRRALMRIAHEIVERTEAPERLYLIAIPNGGVPLGRILVDNLESLIDQRVPLGILDTTLYRDDLSIRGSRPRLRRTEMPSSVDDRVVVLVEDVVNTGRTIRAAMDALMDFGRPSEVRVVSLVDRGHRELPIKIDHVGKNIPTQSTDKVIFRRADLASSAEGGTGEEILGGADAELELVVRGGAGS